MSTTNPVNQSANKCTPAVLEMGKLPFTGTHCHIPHTWYKHDALKFDPNKKGERKHNYVAMVILSDICYWYRPAPVLDTVTKEKTWEKNKFAADKLHKYYSEWAEQFDFTKREVRDAVYFLVGRGLISLELRDVKAKGKINKDLTYFEPVMPALAVLFSEPEPRIEGVSSPGTATQPCQEDTKEEAVTESGDAEPGHKKISLEIDTGARARMIQDGVLASLTGFAESVLSTSGRSTNLPRLFDDLAPLRNDLIGMIRAISQDSKRSDKSRSEARDALAYVDNCIAFVKANKSATPAIMWPARYAKTPQDAQR